MARDHSEAQAKPPNTGTVLSGVGQTVSAAVHRTEKRHRTEPVELARYQVTDFAHFIALPDGRAVRKQQIAGRNRLVVVADGKEPIALSGAADDTDFPVALAGPRDIAFVLGKDRRTIAIGSIATGVIARRIPFEKSSIEMMISTPDGQTLYCTAGGAIRMHPTAGGAPTRLRAGNAIATDPAGKDMAVIDVFEGRVPL
jgi:hypothetical protein